MFFNARRQASARSTSLARIASGVRCECRPGGHHRRDRRVSAIWRRVADGEMAFYAGAALLALEAGAKRRLADEYDAAQERGEISKQALMSQKGT